ncbi:PAS domain S-box protein [Undibacterium sp. Dicai25W]|uniref:PAS domain S-box protein n=1 Tax=Undibacterium sp. Dicai25W TaxID=3413034 RepID=UPI003BF3AAD8
MQRFARPIYVSQFADFHIDIVAMFDSNLRHTYVNSAIENYTGLKPKDFVGKTNYELGMPKDLVTQWDEALEHVFRTGESRDLTFTFPGVEGNRDFHSRLVAERDSSGNVASVISFARDVTEAELCFRSDMVNKYETGLIQAILDSVDDAVIGKTLDGVVTSWNGAAEAMFGYKAEEMLGRSILRLFPPDRLDEEKFILEKLQYGEKIDHLETVRVHKSGRLIHVTVTTSPIRNLDGKVVGACKIVKNVTPLIVERQRLELALLATNSGLWDWDLINGTVYLSDLYLKITGSDKQQETHDFDHFKRTIHPNDLEQTLKTIDKYLEGHTEHIEFDYRLAANSSPKESWVTTQAQIVERDLLGRPSRLVGTITDTTEIKKTYSNLLDREKRLTRVIDGSDQGYWDWNIQSNSLEVSPRWAEMLGYTLEEVDVANGGYEKLVHPDDLVSVMETVLKHIQGKLPNLEQEIRCLTKTGEWKWILTRGRVVEWDDGRNPLMVSGTHTDITERKKLEMSLREAATVFDNSYDGIVVVNTDGLVSRTNPSFSRITGFSAEEVIGKSYQSLFATPLKRRFYEQLHLSLSKYKYWNGELWGHRKNDQTYPVLLSISSVVDEKNGIEHYIGIFSDISHLKEHEAELDRVAHYDPLTGTPNRRLLSDRLQQSIVRADRQGKSLAVCYLDLDGFKYVNDHFGHQAGDDLLVAIVNNLKQVLRAEDTLSRLGGDEFVLLINGCERPEECSIILDRILNTIKIPITIDKAVISVSASIGVSLYPNDHSDADTLLRHADQAMYRAKESGKNRYHLFDPDSDQKAQRQREIISRLHNALQNDELTLYFQPKVDLRNGAVVGVEALIRWQHPERGLLSPAAFLPQVEGSTAEYPIGKWVISTAIRKASQWLIEGFPLKVSVNISANQLMHPEFLNDLRLALAEHPEVPAAHLELEVLESVSISDVTRTVEILAECHRIGVMVSLDDFGTGYSSLTYLRKLPVDTLKIDQSFVRDMLTDPEDHGIVNAVINLAKSFNRQVIAEGVETLAHGNELLRMGCHLVQGYGIAKPMPGEEIQTWIKYWLAQRNWECI